MFCTNCGVKYGSVDRFCRECGEAVNPASSRTVENLGNDNLCSFKDETSAKMAVVSSRVKIIFTHLGKLRERTGNEFSEFKALLDRFMVGQAGNGGVRMLLDAGDNFLDGGKGGDWRAHVKLLRSAIDWLSALKIPTSSVFIVGDDWVIPMPCLDNPVGMDDDLDSDHPFSTLSDVDPWEELHEAVISVGRLPVGAACGTLAASRYLKNILGLKGLIETAEPLGFGAAVWEGASKATLATFSKKQISLAPPSDAGSVGRAISAHCGLLYFNLHGSNEFDEPDWVGQSRMGEYPKTVSPSHFAVLAGFNIVGVEACYGGRFIGHEAQGSCLLSGLGNRTLGFLGASRIAFGPPEPPCGLADIVVGDFLRFVAHGRSLGEAHVAARNSLIADAETDAHARLTILEFNLFGDPEFNPFLSPSALLDVTKGRAEGGSNKGFPDTVSSRLREQIRSQTQLARRKIGATIRKIDIGALIGAEIQRSLARCRDLADNHVSKQCPGALGGLVAESCYGTGGKTVLLRHYYRKNRGGPFVGMSLKQDIATGILLNSYFIK